MHVLPTLFQHPPARQLELLDTVKVCLPLFFLGRLEIRMSFPGFIILPKSRQVTTITIGSAAIKLIEFALNWVPNDS